MKMMRVTGPNADKYNCQEDYEKYNPKETVNCILSIMSEMFDISVEDVREHLSQAFQNKEIIRVGDKPISDIVFRPDELIIMFRTNDSEVGMFNVTLEDIDAFFDGQPYTLSEFTEEEKMLAKLIREGMEGKMKDVLDELIGKMVGKLDIEDIKKQMRGKFAGAMVAMDIHLERLDVTGCSISPAEIYADKLKCPVEEMLWAINETYTKEIPVGIPNVDKAVAIYEVDNNDEEHVRIVNGTEGVTSLIPLKILYEIDENNQGHCPCPECWRKRHANDKVGTMPVNRTLH